MKNPDCLNCVKATDTNGISSAIPQDSKRKGAKVNFIFIFLCALFLIISMILVLPSAYPTANNPAMAPFFGYIVLYAFLWLMLAIIVKISNRD